MLKNILIALLILLLVLFIAGRIYSVSGRNITSLPEGFSFGLNQGRLAPCKESPNCICTDEKDSHYLEPFPITDSSWKELPSFLKTLKGCSIVERRTDYIRMECRSSVFGFIDDVELYFDTQMGLLRYRSAARLGYSDFGVNRKRIEKIKKQIN